MKIYGFDFKEPKYSQKLSSLVAYISLTQFTNMI